MKISEATLIFLLLWGSLVLPGCIHTEEIMLGPAAAYPPSQNVAILSQRPAGPYKEIAVVEAQGSVSEEDLLASARRKAGDLGADAIVVLPKEQKPGTGGLLFPVVKALAIKYD
jgi:hypothetical protein